MVRSSIAFALLVLAPALASCVAGCSVLRSSRWDPYDSGGEMLPEQAAYDVISYEMDIAVDPASRRIDGAVVVSAGVLSPLEAFVLDLDPRLDISAVETVSGDEASTGAPLSFDRRGGKVWIALSRPAATGDEIRVRVAYGGVPREAPNPPWRGGFTWAQTGDGSHWIATTCQHEGADLWWPVKDHVADEPERMQIRVTVPEPLVVASNGRLVGVESNDDGTRTYLWRVSTPINTYNVALNIAPYETIEGSFTSVAGETFPVIFWVLPEDRENGEKLFAEILEHLAFFESVVGPYPFRADKYGVAQTPHLGMEHQTIIAYGAGFRRGAMTRGTDWGFDVLHHHELSHEWWGNLVTNRDWSDMWLHEGFGTYMQPLYVERTDGPERYHEYLASLRRRIANRRPLAPLESLSSNDVYTGDIYFKGAWVLHTLRYLIGDEAMFLALRRMAYPDPDLERTTDGSACRFATTDDFVRIAEEVAGRDLDWFFEVYVRRASLPRLETTRKDTTLTLRWKTPGGLPFPMPIDVRIGDETRRLDIPRGGASMSVPAGVTAEIDPDEWVLRAP